MRRQESTWIASLILACTCLHAMAATRGLVWQEGWWYYDLAQSIGVDFYRFHAWRGFLNHIPYSSASPPLFPIVIAIVHWATGMGPMSGVLANYIGLIALTALHEAIFRRLFRIHGVGLLLSLCVLGNWVFSVELHGASNHVWPLVILAGQMLCVLRASEQPHLLYAVALLGGLALMCRFDMMLTEISIMLFVLWEMVDSRAEKLKLFGTFIVPILPWSFYSLARFGEIFASDNTWLATLAEQGFVTDYRRNAYSTLFSAPLQWTLLQYFHVRASVKGFLMALNDSLLPAFWAIGGVVMIVTHRRAYISGGDCKAARKVTRCCLFLVVACAVGLVSHTLVGFSSERYFLPLIWSMEISTTAFLVALLDTRRRSPLPAWALVCLAAFVNSCIALRGYYGEAKELQQYLRGDEYHSLQACLKQLDIDGEETVLVSHMSGALSSRLGVLTRQRIAGLPNNWSSLSRRDVYDFVEEYSIRYIFVPEEVSKNAVDTVGLRPIDVSSVIPLRKVDNCDAPLYRIAQDVSWNL